MNARMLSPSAPTISEKTPMATISDTREQLISEGLEVAAALVVAAEQYHVKDDRRDILDYEAAIVDAHVRWLRDGVPVPSNLETSVLLGPWGRNLDWKESLLLRRVAAFLDTMARFHRAKTPAR